MHAVWLLLCFLSTCRAGAQEHELWDDYEDEYNIPGSDAHGGRHRRYSPYNTWAPQHRPRKADILRKDFFKQFITHFRDPAINACDNFYRHICPVSMDIRDTYQGQVQENRHDESWGIVGGAFEDEIEFDFVPDPDQLMGRQLQEEMRAMVEEMHEDVPTLREEGRLLGTLMKDTLYIADRVEVMTDVLDCFSGHHTFTEDRSDVTGLRIAWEAFRAEIREQWPSEEALKHIVYPELGVTRAQLFFYTRAIRYCDTNDRSQHFMGARGLAVHSATRIRVNMVHCNMEEFAQAFNCKPGDRMVQRPTCPYF
ncbi:unnamed protein product, partial [Mesorhabditis spiculigera]